MPPKSASTAPPQRRTSRNTKSVPNSNYYTPINFPLPPSATTTTNAASVIPPPLTVIPASPEPSQKNLPVNCDGIGNTTAASSRATTPFCQTQRQNSQKALVTNSGAAKSAGDRIVINDNPEMETSVDSENATFEHLGSENAVHVDGETVVGSGNGARNETILSSVRANGPRVNDESSIQPVPGPESVASGVEVLGKAKRKIVKKTVRVVKKVIKKRVPKRVLISGSENQGMMERAENCVRLNEVTKSSNLAINLVEKSNLMDEVSEKNSIVNELMEQSNITKCTLVEGVAEKTSLVSEVMEKSNIVDEVMKTSKLDNAHDVEPTACGEGNDVSDIDSVEAEALKLNNDAIVSQPVIGKEGDLSCTRKMEASGGNAGTHVVRQIVCKKSNYPRDIHSMGKDHMNSNDAMTGVDIKDLNVCGPDSVELEKINYAAESTTMESDRTKDYVMESAQEHSVVVNQNIDVVKKDVGPVPSQNVGPLGDKAVVCVGKENGSTIGNSESGSGEVENDSVGLNDGQLLSEEMEALERKKRRKTEIYLGGLHKDAKEDDIRKVFEEDGTIVEVRLMMNSKTGKNRGFAFVRFATAADAKNALAKYSKVEICGKQCDAAPVEGNDTIFLGSIDRKWKTEDVVQLLEKAGVEKIDKVTLKADPNNIEKNRGFAFVELETSKDAQIAFRLLQKKNVLAENQNQKIKVAWARPLIEPTEEEILKVKSVYAEYLPSSWDEEKVKEYFRRFGEIESVVLAKDLPSSRRKDFAFINYTTRDAALECVEAVGRDRVADHGYKVKMTASLAKPISESKQRKLVSSVASKQLPKENPKASEAPIKLHEPSNKGKLASSSYGCGKVDASSSTTDELLRVLRQQVSSNHIHPPHSIGTSIPDYHFPLPGSKRPFSLVGHDPLYLEPSRLPRMHFESSYPVSGPSYLFNGLSKSSFPYHHRQGPGFAYESVKERDIHPSHFQTREQALYYGKNSIYRRN